MAFESAARRSSFKLAADELHLTPSAVSHQIAKLEEQLDRKLFERTGRQITLTPSGIEYLSRLSGALDTISVATDVVDATLDRFCEILPRDFINLVVVSHAIRLRQRTS
jgi:DNA-binding transcriptional LysR family regulator